MGHEGALPPHGIQARRGEAGRRAEGTELLPSSLLRGQAARGPSLHQGGGHSAGAHPLGRAGHALSPVYGTPGLCLPKATP